MTRLAGIRFHRTHFLRDAFEATVRSELAAAPELMDEMLQSMRHADGALPGEQDVSRDPEVEASCLRHVSSAWEEDDGFKPPWPGAIEAEVEKLVEARLMACSSLRPGEEVLLQDSAVEVAFALLAGRASAVAATKGGSNRLVLLDPERVLPIVRQELRDEPNHEEAIASLGGAMREGRAAYDAFTRAKLRGLLASAASRNLTTVREIAAHCRQEGRLPAHAHKLSTRLCNLKYQLPRHLLQPALSEFALLLRGAEGEQAMVEAFRACVCSRHADIAGKAFLKLGRFARGEARRMAKRRRGAGGGHVRV